MGTNNEPKMPANTHTHTHAHTDANTHIQWQIHALTQSRSCYIIQWNAMKEEQDRQGEKKKEKGGEREGERC